MNPCLTELLSSYFKEMLFSTMSGVSAAFLYSGFARGQLSVEVPLLEHVRRLTEYPRQLARQLVTLTSSPSAYRTVYKHLLSILLAFEELLANVRQVQVHVQTSKWNS